MEKNITLKGTLKEMQLLFNNGEAVFVRYYTPAEGTPKGFKDTDEISFSTLLRLPDDFRYRGISTITKMITADENYMRVHFPDGKNK